MAKKGRKRIMFLLAAYVLIAAFCCCLARADGMPPVDENIVPTLEIICQCDEAPVEGMVLKVYRVGDIGSYGELTLNGPFAEIDISSPKDHSEWDRAAAQIEKICQKEQLTPITEGKSDAHGSFNAAKDKNLGQGLYLVIGQEVDGGDSVMLLSSFLVALPTWDAETRSWEYHVTARPKIEKRAKDTPTPTPTHTHTPTPTPTRKPNHTPTPTPRPGKISPTPGGGTAPQTGVLLWPIPLLFAVGILLLLIGHMQRRGSS